VTFFILCTETDNASAVAVECLIPVVSAVYLTGISCVLTITLKNAVPLSGFGTVSVTPFHEARAAEAWV
jgi:hypothetical protein